ncbi:MAG TPA: recombination mediator RecR [Anaerolineae bacterium]|nr:recombination mediator RecR [Anaerolineae bacterium]
MDTIPKAVTQLVEAFAQLPGIGPKTASRLTYYLLKDTTSKADVLAEALRDLKTGTVFCATCFNIADTNPCAICTSEARDAGVICVVEEPLDVQAIERTREYQGRYHVLHGAISPMEGIGPDDLRIRELLDRVAAGPVREVILATNPSLEGENTAMYIQKKLAGSGARVTRLARGLPVGGDLEYADEVTLARALEGRREM